MSRQEKREAEQVVTTGSVRPMSQVSENSSAIRPSSASARPIWRAAALLMLGQPAGDDRQEDQVVDAEHDLQRGQRQQAGP